MYSPIKDGIDKAARTVQYVQAKPPADISTMVDCFWELKTYSPLAVDFELHALPDACVNILFNQLDTQIAGVTALRTTYEVLNLGKIFHYAGIQFLPGVWRGNPTEITDSFVGTAYHGELPLAPVGERLAATDFAGKQIIMADLVRQLKGKGLVEPNNTIQQILTNLDEIYTVADMASVAHLSARQLQRLLKQTTGFSPHDLLKVLRLQRSLKQHDVSAYTDQSHFIHSFRKITGYTPAKYFQKFDV